MTAPEESAGSPQSLFCAACGDGIPADAKFCGKCGAPVTGAGPVAALPPGPPSRGIPGWAWVLIILGICVVGGCILSFLAAIIIPNVIEARSTGNETAAIGALRTISSVQAQFREGDREGDLALDYATSLAELSQAGLIDNVLGSGLKSGYVFTLSGSTYEWQCSATPVSKNTGRRNFIICTDGVVRFSVRHQPADCYSAAIY